MQERSNASYEIDYIPLTELIWGKGFIAPGGEGNVDRIVAGVDLKSKRVLELGSGAGGGTLVLAAKYGAQVLGLELEQSLVELSRQYAQEAGLSEQIEFRCVEPGPLPVEDASFDALYTSGVVCHIEDRHAFFNEVMRILKPGGMLLGYDWFVTTQSDAIDTWLQAAELHLFQGNLDAYLDGMRAVGFDEVSGEDVSAWYLKKADAELLELEGPLFEQATELSGAEIRDRMLTEWRTMNRVLKSGELKSGYFRACKPG